MQYVVLFILSASTHLKNRGAFIFILALSLVSFLTGCARHEAVRTTGYLSKGPPSALRFATYVAPPQSLPPLPKSEDPQPTLPFEQETSSIETSQSPAPIAGINPPPAANAPSGTISNQVASTQAQQESLAPDQMAQLKSQILLKFSNNGRPAGFEVLPDPAITFQSPVMAPSSSATYQVK